MGAQRRRAAARTRALDAYVKLMRCADTVQGDLERALESVGISEGQFGVLEALLHLGPMSATELRQKVFRSGGNVTMVMDNLEKRGYLRRRRVQDDRRRLCVSLTPEGERVIKRLFPPHAARITGMFSSLTPDEQNELARLCKKLGLSVGDRHCARIQSRTGSRPAVQSAHVGRSSLSGATRPSPGRNR